MLLEFTLAVAAPLTFHYDASEWTNVAYNVACLAEHVPCSKPLYETFWKDQQGWTADDAAHLEAWKSVIDRLAQALPPSPPAPLLPGVTTYHPRLKQRMSVVAAALGSRSLDDFRRRIAPLTSPADAATLSATLEHYQRRLHSWWVSTGARLVETHIVDVQAAMHDDDVAVSTQVAEFMGSRLPSPDVYVHAVPSPAASGDSAGATVVDNHFVVEVLARTKASDTVWVALHELTHAYFDAAPESVHRELMSQFVAARGVPFYTYFNEALATAVQRIVVEQTDRRARGQAAEASPAATGQDDDGYRHPYIPRLGRALQPVLQRALSEGQTITGGLVAAFLQAGRAELKAEATAPVFVFGSTALFANEPQYGAREAFRRTFHVWSSVADLDQWRRFGDTSAVFIADYTEVNGFADQIPDLVEQTRHRAFAYVTPYQTQSRVLVLAGRDQKALLELIDRVAALPVLPPSGVFVVIN